MAPFIFTPENMIVICHVDYLIVLAEKQSLMVDFMFGLSKKFKVKYLGWPR